MPRVSLPSSSSASSYAVHPTSSSRVAENISSTGRDSASTTPSTSAPTSRITIAVCRDASSVTGSVVSSTKPTQSARPSATTSVVPSRCRTSSRPRSTRSTANSLVSERSRPRTSSSSRMAARVGSSYVSRWRSSVTWAWAATTGAPRDQSPLLSALGRSNMFWRLYDASRVRAGPEPGGGTAGTSERMASMPTSIADLTWPVVTDRLSLRPAVAADADAVLAYRRLPEVNEYMTSAPSDAAEWAEVFGQEDRLSKTLVAEHDGRVIGDLMIAVEDAWAQTEVRSQAEGVQAEIGWCLDPAYQGRGLATEAVAAVLDDLLRRARPAPCGGQLLRRQPRLATADGAARDAAGAAHGARVAPPLRPLAGRDGLRAARGRVALPAHLKLRSEGSPRSSSRSTVRAMISRKRTTVALAAALACLGLAAPLTTTAEADVPPPTVDKDVRFATFNASLNRNSRRPAAHRPVDRRRTRRRATLPRSSSAARRTSCWSTSSTTTRTARRPSCSATTTSRSRRTALLPPTTPTTSSRRATPGCPAASTWTTSGRVGGPRRRLRLRLLPRPVRHGRLLEVPHRHRGRPDLPELPVEGHARGEAARRPGHGGARGLVLPRGAGRLPAVQQVALGRADHPRAEQDRALPGLAPHAAGLRRSRGPQRHPQLRRDPLLGRLRRQPVAVVVHLRRRRRVPAVCTGGRSS